jgi:hypothetical protein
VLYALDAPDGPGSLADYFPDRAIYRYRWDRAARQGRLERIDGVKAK